MTWGPSLDLSLAKSRCQCVGGPCNGAPTQHTSRSAGVPCTGGEVVGGPGGQAVPHSPPVPTGPQTEPIPQRDLLSPPPCECGQVQAGGGVSGLRRPPAEVIDTIEGLQYAVVGHLLDALSSACVGDEESADISNRCAAEMAERLPPLFAELRWGLGIQSDPGMVLVRGDASGPAPGDASSSNNAHPAPPCGVGNLEEDVGF